MVLTSSDDDAILAVKPRETGEKRKADSSAAEDSIDLTSSPVSSPSNKAKAVPAKVQVAALEASSAGGGRRRRSRDSEFLREASSSPSGSTKKATDGKGAAPTAAETVAEKFGSATDGHAALGASEQGPARPKWHARLSIFIGDEAIPPTPIQSSPPPTRIQL